jgi:protein gp37
MAETTGISWSDATLNFWVGCTKVSTGDHGACEFCYAETWAMRWPAYRTPGASARRGSGSRTPGPRP